MRHAGAASCGAMWPPVRQSESQAPRGGTVRAREAHGVPPGTHGTGYRANDKTGARLAFDLGIAISHLRWCRPLATRMHTSGHGWARHFEQGQVQAGSDAHQARARAASLNALGCAGSRREAAHRFPELSCRPCCGPASRPCPQVLPPTPTRARERASRLDCDSICAGTPGAQSSRPCLLHRKQLKTPFAVLLLRSAYDAMDALDFVATDQFQKSMWKFRQAEFEPYKTKVAPLNVPIGNLSNALYFDFIAFCQFATISDAMPSAPQVFQVCLARYLVARTLLASYIARPSVRHLPSFAGVL